MNIHTSPYIMSSANDKSKSTGDAPNAAGGSTSANNADGSVSTVDFNTMPTSALVSYIDYYGLANRYPFVSDPAPINSPTPPASSHGEEEREEEEEEDSADEEERKRKAEEDLLVEASGKRRAALASAAATSTSYHNGKFRARSPPATTTTSGGSRKRAPAVVETDENEVTGEEPPGDFWDDEDAKGYLAKVAREHFDAQSAPKEGEVVVGFLYRCRTKDRTLKIAQAP